MSTKPKITVIEPIQQQIRDSDVAPSTRLRVAAYARVSTEQDEQ